MLLDSLSIRFSTLLPLSSSTHFQGYLFEGLAVQSVYRFMTRTVALSVCACANSRPVHELLWASLYSYLLANNSDLTSKPDLQWGDKSRTLLKNTDYYLLVLSYWVQPRPELEGRDVIVTIIQGI